jgi:hypothetical protein
VCVCVCVCVCRPLLFFKALCFEQLALESISHFILTLPDVH